MKKKIIIAVVIVVLLVVGGGYFYLNRSSSAVESFNGFITACNKFNLSEMKNYTTDSGDLNKGIEQIESYNQNKKDALKAWAENIKVQVLSTKKSDGYTILTVKIDTLNGVDIYNDFQSSMNSLDINNNTIQDSNLNGDFLGQQYNNAFVDAIQNNMENVTETTIEVKMKREVGNWKIQNDDVVIKGLLGGLSSQAVLS